MRRRSRWSRSLTASALGLVFSAGCRNQEKTAPKVGGDLPVTSSNSVALPDATNAADAKNAPQVAESQAATLTAFHDPETGVSFRFPTVWRPPQVAPVVAPAFSEKVGAARMIEQFLPEGNYYEPTVLRALSFSYAVAKQMNSAASCAALPGGLAAAAGPSKQVNYNGTPFTEVPGGDAGACTHVAFQVDSTWQHGRCLVFERDFVTSCPFVKSQTQPRPLTDKEQAALQRHLDAVMQSVQIAVP